MVVQLLPLHLVSRTCSSEIRPGDSLWRSCAWRDAHHGGPAFKSTCSRLRLFSGFNSPAPQPSEFCCSHLVRPIPRWIPLLAITWWPPFLGPCDGVSAFRSMLPPSLCRLVDRRYKMASLPPPSLLATIFSFNLCSLQQPSLLAPSLSFHDQRGSTSYFYADHGQAERHDRRALGSC